MIKLQWGSSLFQITLFLLALCSGTALAQGLAFKELYGGRKAGQLEISHKQPTSTWGSPYGKLSTSSAAITSEKYDCALAENCAYRVQAGYLLDQFEKRTFFGQTLEDPEFSGLVEWTTSSRYLIEAGVRSPSDRPFHSFYETTINFNGILAPKEDLREIKDNYWLFILNYSNTRSFLPDIPLPGFTYVIRTESGWTYSLGAPFVSVSYFDFRKWSFRLSVGPYFYSTQLSYGPPFLQAGLSSSWRQSSYFLYERTNRQERLYLDEKELSLFFKAPIKKGLLAELKTSYLFDQNMRMGETYSTSSSRPEESLGSSAVISINFRVNLDSIGD
ncbi:hypothetical protein GW916_14475 [bacterium]|nr:hypothetical protein [bacterium]